MSVSEEEMKEHLARAEDGRSSLVFDPKEHSFSPTSLDAYDECPKKYELKHLYGLPERGAYDGEPGRADMGSFIHKVLEEGVDAGYKTEKEYLDHADRMLADPEWDGLDREDAHDLIKVFWIRNREKIMKGSETEVELRVEIGDFRFYGKADRADPLKDGTWAVTDYKTGNGEIPPKKRARQMGFYAIALGKTGRRVSRITLDMLAQKKPIEYDVDKDGNAKSLGRERASASKRWRRN